MNGGMIDIIIWSVRYQPQQQRFVLLKFSLGFLLIHFYDLSLQLVIPFTGLKPSIFSVDIGSNSNSSWNLVDKMC